MIYPAEELCNDLEKLPEEFQNGNLYWINGLGIEVTIAECYLDYNLKQILFVSENNFGIFVESHQTFIDPTAFKTDLSLDEHFEKFGLSDDSSDLLIKDIVNEMFYAMSEDFECGYEEAFCEEVPVVGIKLENGKAYIITRD